MTAPIVQWHGSCVAAIDMVAGVALLALPRPEDDVLNPFAKHSGQTMGDGDAARALTALDAQGVELDMDYWLGRDELPTLSNGRPVLLLSVREPVSSHWGEATDEEADAGKSCRAALEAATA